MNSSAGAVIVAAGIGRRFGETGRPKQYGALGGKPLLAYSLELFERMAEFAAMVVVINPDHRQLFDEVIERGAYSKLIAVVDGGAVRQDSVRNGLEALAARASVGVAAVHDAARPFPPPESVAQAVAVAVRDGAAILAAPVTDTIKLSTDENVIERTLDRSRLWAAQTPQVARLDLLREALRAAAAHGRNVTDEAAALEAIGVPVRLIPSTAANLKITHPGDWRLAEFLLRDHQ